MSFMFFDPAPQAVKGPTNGTHSSGSGATDATPFRHFRPPTGDVTATLPPDYLTFVTPFGLPDHDARTSPSAAVPPTQAADNALPITPSPLPLPIHQDIIERLDSFIATHKIPHIIFHGRSGSGKMTLVKEFIRKIYAGNKDKIKQNVMTVNCSHGKGIQFIRDELKFFAKSNIQTTAENAEFKTILLLNAHHLTVDAQSALRRCIELFSLNTRFIIVVENKNKLLNPILSRFCDIYVPEYVDPATGETVNLHQFVVDRQFRHHQPQLAAVAAILSQHDNRPWNSVELAETAERLYEQGLSCLDLMQWVKTRTDRWSVAAYSRAIMRFNTVKSVFRCEKLLLLFMLVLLYSGDGAK
jgi:hypothetical protein